MRFPRAVSPLSYEPVVPSKIDVVYHTDTSSDEESEERQAKRRRIEEHGIRYLQGLPVYIMTARLKGPFDNSWKNPWQKPRKSKRGGDTDIKTLGRENPAIPETVWRDLPEVESTEVRKDKRSRTKRSTPQSAAKISHVNNKSTKSTSWLRKDRDLRSFDTEGPQRSPSPSRRSDAGNLPLIGVKEDGVPENIVEPHNAVLEPESKISTHDGGSGLPNIRNMGELNKIHEAGVVEHIHKQTDSLTIHMEGARREHIHRGHRKPRRMDFASSPSILMKPMEDKMTKAEDPQDEQQPRNANNQLSLNLASDQEGSAARTSERKQENPDKADAKEDGQSRSTSNAAIQSVIAPIPPNVVHSAQIVPLVTVQCQSESTPSIEPIPTAVNPHAENEKDICAQDHNDIVADDFVLGLSTQAAITKVQEKLRAELSSTETPRSADATNLSMFEEGQRSKDGIKLFRSLNIFTPTASHADDDILNAEHADTQAMLGAITPFALGTVKAKPSTRVISKSSPTEMKPKQKKRASFAPTSQDSSSSTGSIKSCLRVTKPTSSFTSAKIHGPLGKPTAEVRFQPSLSFQHPGDLTSEFTPDDIGSLTKHPSSLDRDPLQAKTHPNATPLSSTAPFSSTLYTAPEKSEIQPDAQPVPDRANLDLEHDDLGGEFDLSAAMDDVGSFLQGWDAEKEMRNLSAARV